MALTPTALSASDTRRLVDVLARHALAFPAGARAFFGDLVRRSDLPIEWKQQQADVWLGDARFDGRKLVQFAVAKGTVPSSGGWTTLGSLVRVLLEDGDVGLEDASELAALVEIYQLAPAESLDKIRLKFGIPNWSSPASADSFDRGPEFRWRGSSDAVELQSWLKPEPPLFDVAFLARAIQNAATVCRLELSNRNRNGTGVRIARDLVLTNHHVMQWDPNEDIHQNARDAVVHFSAMANMGGPRSERSQVRLSTVEPICKWSERLDYAVLRLDPSAAADMSQHFCRFANRNLHQRAGVNILQHPFGGSMKLAICASGVTDVFEREGLVQYVTTSAGGSSGAPCFNDDWEVAALHHAQRARPFGRIGEGILISAIKQDIASLLNA